MSANTDPVKLAQTRLAHARRIVFFTGAGMSAESGIPTFRDVLTGLWAHYDPEQLATPQGFLHDPSLVWGWYEWRRMRALQALPNAGHWAIAEFAARHFKSGGDVAFTAPQSRRRVRRRCLSLQRDWLAWLAEFGRKARRS